jgi:carotenoid cleavage dioxygenase
MAWHTLNAFDEGSLIRLDLCEQAAPAFPTPDGRASREADLRQRLARWTLDLSADGPVATQRLSDVVCEYPRIDERRTGRPYRYGFVAAEGGPGTGDLAHRALGRFDHLTGEMRLWRAPDGQSVSEPVVVPRADEEGAGWLLAVVYEHQRDASHVAVLDAERIEAGPVARAVLDHRVPAGFHGSFVRG